MYQSYGSITIKDHIATWRDSHFQCTFSNHLWYDWNIVLNKAVVILAVGYAVLSRLSKFLLFTSSLWKAMSVIRVWAISAHGICNRFEVRFCVFPFS